MLVLNSAPLVTAPFSQNVEANTNGAIAGLSVFDAESAVLNVKVTADHGTLDFTDASGASITHNGTGSVILDGTQAQLNAALSHLQYHGSADFFGVDTLLVSAYDNDPVSPLSNTASVRINVNTLAIGSNQDDTFTAAPGNERIDAGDGVDTVTFGFKLTDARVNISGDTTVIDGPNGSHTVMTGVEKFVFTDGTVSNNDDDVLVNDLFYYTQYHDVWAAGVDADAHYHQSGWREGRMPNETGAGGPITAIPGRVAANGFDYDYYLAHNADVAAAGVDAFQHFETYGWKEGRDPNALFDVKGYLAAYADVKAAGINPLDHYNEAGWKEGRDPSAAFDTSDYLAHYTDVAAAHVNPLTHFLSAGMAEGRAAFADGVFG